MLRKFVIGWLCLTGMVVYVLLVGAREFAQTTITAGQAMWGRGQALRS
jgi:hypothetical protein